MNLLFLHVFNKPNCRIDTISDLVQYLVPVFVHVTNIDRVESAQSVGIVTLFDILFRARSNCWRQCRWWVGWVVNSSHICEVRVILLFFCEL